MRNGEESEEDKDKANTAAAAAALTTTLFPFSISAKKIHFENAQIEKHF